jgi:holo-[acyl-carrier protein] synthase
MIKGIGIDLVNLDRLKAKDERFVKRILSEKEFAYYQTMANESRRLTYLGGRFAAKEALFKAISKGDGTINYHDFTILNDIHGKPFVAEKPDLVGDVTIHLSISHTETHALAHVILEIE